MNAFIQPKPYRPMPAYHHWLGMVDDDLNIDEGTVSLSTDTTTYRIEFERFEGTVNIDHVALVFDDENLIELSLEKLPAGFLNKACNVIETACDQSDADDAAKAQEDAEIAFYGV